MCDYKFGLDTDVCGVKKKKKKKKKKEKGKRRRGRPQPHKFNMVCNDTSKQLAEHFAELWQRVL